MLLFLLIGSFAGSIFYYLSYVFWKPIEFKIETIGFPSTMESISFYEGTTRYLIQKRVMQVVMFCLMRYLFSNIVSVASAFFLIGFSYNCFICNLLLQNHFEGMILGEMVLMPSTLIYMCALLLWVKWFIIWEENDTSYYDAFINRTDYKIVKLCKYFVIILLLIVACIIELYFSKNFLN